VRRGIPWVSSIGRDGLLIGEVAPKHLDGDLVIVPLPSNAGEHRAEISGRAKSDSLLRDQEAVCLQVVAGARNHLQAKRPLEFSFGIVI